VTRDWLLAAAFDQWHSSGVHEREFVMEHANWGPEFRDDEIAALLSSREGENTASQSCVISKIENQDELCRTTAATSRRGFGGRMVPGADGMGTAGVGQSQYPGRSATGRDARHPQFENQAPRDVPAVRALNSGEAAGDYFTQSYPSPFMLMAYSAAPEKRGEHPGHDDV